MTSLQDAKNTLFICIDLQEKLLPLMACKDEVVKNANILLKAADILGVKTLISEQYPKGLGKTHSDINIAQNALVLEKTSFGIFNDEKIKEFIFQSGCKSLVFFGIESHICVLSSLIDGINLGFECIFAADASSSRNLRNHQLALEFLAQIGVMILPSESILFRILGSSTHPNFKAISALVK